MNASPVWLKLFGGLLLEEQEWVIGYRELRMGHQSVEDELRAGRPQTSVPDENVAAVRKLITEDPHITIAK